MKLPFVKLEGLGNCYIFVEARNVRKFALPRLARRISHVATGIGSDGLIVVDTAKEPFAMRIFNKDGSEAELCGNGLRQAALYIKRLKRMRAKKMKLQTVAGEFPAEIISSQDNKAIIKTALAKPAFDAKAVGLKKQNNLTFDISVKTSVGQFKVDGVRVGNPHAVVWVNNYDFDWPTAGQEISTSSLFPKGINVHFCRVANSRKFQMKIYERGSGVTEACGSGAAACLAAGVMRSYLYKRAKAEMPGGILKLHWEFKDGLISQEGPASEVCGGEYYI
jgi:diaminopimelate epimerase